MIKMAIVSKMIYRLKTLSKSQVPFLQKIHKLILKFTSKCKKPGINKIILKKKNKGGLTHSNFKTYHKGKIIRT